ncbi:MAG TPA: 3'(2'),5'-bisphosphate nucleotidase CysQ [Candidatus Sulfomarinibacteraceae bacterium]|nr:3'(2'),5'-bisphosphate nucleotidase CysQ [Candidatus Sulfomarinibacteraceae bacterium]
MNHSLPEPLAEQESVAETLAETVHITRAAGDVIMAFYRSSFEVHDKKPDNPVTDADFAADSLLKQRLLALLPQAGWLSEETVDNPQRLEKELVWVVDPLDGTKEFVMGIPEFSVSVALVHNGAPLLGVILNPASSELYTAVRGQGLRFNGDDGSVSDRASLQGAVVDASRSEWKRGEFDPFKELVTVNVMGSIAYKLARVAAGQADASWSRGPKNEWDICAGALLVQEAGGRCVDLNGDPFTFNRPNPKVNGIIADNGYLHQELMDALAPHGAARLK